MRGLALGVSGIPGGRLISPDSLAEAFIGHHIRPLGLKKTRKGGSGESCFLYLLVSCSLDQGPYGLEEWDGTQKGASGPEPAVKSPC